MVQQIAVARTNLRISQVFVNLKGLCLYPFAVFPVESLLGNLTDIDFWVEVGCKCLVVIAGVTVNDVQILNLLKVVLSSISRIDRGDTWVETTTKDCCETSLIEAVAVSPLP